MPVPKNVKGNLHYIKEEANFSSMKDTLPLGRNAQKLRFELECYLSQNDYRKMYFKYSVLKKPKAQQLINAEFQLSMRPSHWRCGRSLYC